MLFVPGSCPELMEYAGLFIGLCGVKEALEDLQPPPAVLFVEGDCSLDALRWHAGCFGWEHVHPRWVREALRQVRD